jgi:hypothetical protein
MITEDQLKVIRVIFTMFWQSVIMIVVIIAFFRVLNHLLKPQQTDDFLKLLALEVFLMSTVYVAFKFWFVIPWGKKRK